MSASTSTGWMRALLWLAAVAIVGALIAGVLVWYMIFRVEATRYDSAEEHFKYGSIATEYTAGVPFFRRERIGRAHAPRAFRRAKECGKR